MSKKDMSAVIARCLNGDSLAQEELVLAVQDRVYYHCRKMLKDDDRAFDLTQDTLMAMLTGLDKLQNPDAFWTWLGGITANLCRNAINRSPREMQIPEDEEGNSLLDTYETLDAQAIPDKALDNDETRRMIAELVDDLPDAQRQCVLLYYYDEMSVKDIASSLDVSENTIKSRLNYARKSIKEGVERYEKQGVKLYGLSPLPFLLFFLGKDAKACSMTAEQAAALTQQVVQNVSAVAAGTGAAAAASGTAAGGSSAASAGAATATAKAATAAAGKGLAGLSTKVIAGALAGLVAVGGITGGVLLNKDKDTNSIPMEYIAPPTWVEEPFDRVEEFIYPESELSVVGGYGNEDGTESRICWYSTDKEAEYFSAYASPDNSQINEAHVWSRDGIAHSIHWNDISLGDSFCTVLDKLGLVDIPLDEDIDNMGVHCYCYTDAPGKSEYDYYTHDPEGRSDLSQLISLYYFESGNSSDSGSLMTLQFKQGVLDSFHYSRKHPNPTDTSTPSVTPTESVRTEDDTQVPVDDTLEPGSYRIRYYYDGVLDADNTVIGSASLNSVIAEYPDKSYNDGSYYKEDYMGNFPLTITSDGNNTMDIYYKSMETAQYTIEYYYNGTLDNSRTVSDTVEIGTVISVYPGAGDYWRTDYTDNFPLTVTADGNNTIKVFCVESNVAGNIGSFTTDPKQLITYTTNGNGLLYFSDRDGTQLYKSISYYAESQEDMRRVNVMPDDGYVFSHWTDDIESCYVSDSDFLAYYQEEMFIDSEGNIFTNIYSNNYIAVFEEAGIVTYYVEYFIDMLPVGAISEKAAVGTVISEYPKYPDLPDGYVVNKVVNLPLTVTEDGDNTIFVLYKQTETTSSTESE